MSPVGAGGFDVSTFCLLLVKCWILESGAGALLGMEALPGLSGFRGGVHERHDATWRIAELNTDFWSCVEGATPDGPNPKAGSAAHTRQASGGKCNGCSTTYAPDAKHTAWFSLEATKGHAAFPESVGIGIRIPFRKQAKLRALAVHLFVLRGESIDFTLLRLDLLLEREVVGCTSVDGVEKQHSNHNAHVYWNKNHGQQ